MTASSAKVPSADSERRPEPSARRMRGVIEIVPSVSQRWLSSRMQWKQIPQTGNSARITRSPVFTRVTSEPVSRIVPEPSWPRMTGSSIPGMPPAAIVTSEWHTPLALIWTRAFAGPRGAVLTSSISSGFPYSVSSAARIRTPHVRSVTTRGQSANFTVRPPPAVPAGVRSESYALRSNLPTQCVGFGRGSGTPSHPEPGRRSAATIRRATTRLQRRLRAEGAPGGLSTGKLSVLGHLFRATAHDSRRARGRGLAAAAVHDPCPRRPRARRAR